MPYIRHSAGCARALFLLACACSVLPAEEGKRVALVIGNNAYSMRPLQNAVNDARAVGKALEAAGFRTILRENATKVAMEQAAADFLQSLGPEDTALFYYAGHAVQIENENVLIPVDFAAANTVIEAKFKSFSLGLIFDYLKSSVRVKRSIVIVDACRSNPIAEGHSLQAGLAIPLNAGKETYIAFSTSPNHFAADNPQGRNSWFTEALADLIQEPGLTIDEVFNQVRMRVERSTEGKQTPWSQTSLTGKFYFHPPEGVTESRFDVTEKRLQAALRHEQRENWDEAIDLMNQVAAGKQGDALEAAARRKLPYLTARRDARARMEAGDFAAAAALYDQAFQADPFSLDAALEGVNAYLLVDRLPDAVRLLHAVRLRGTSAAIARSADLLKELTPVSLQAEQEVEAGVPEPPPIQDVLGELRIASVDFEAGKRFTRSFPPDVTHWLKEAAIAVEASRPPAPVAPAAPIAAEATAPAAVAAPSGEAAPVAAAPGQILTVSLDSFHLEVITASVDRDIAIQPVGGMVHFMGNREDVPVFFDGRQVSREVPFNLRLQPGKYEVRAVQDGKILSQQAIEVKALRTVEITVGQHP